MARVGGGAGDSRARGKDAAQGDHRHRAGAPEAAVERRSQGVGAHRAARAHNREDVGAGAGADGVGGGGRGGGDVPEVFVERGHRAGEVRDENRRRDRGRRGIRRRPTIESANHT